MQYKKIDIEVVPQQTHRRHRENTLWVVFLGSMGLALLVTYCL